MIRATSLSGVANHYVSISPGPNSNPPLEEGATLGLASTTTPVDIDQLFNTFPSPVRRGLGQFIQGNAAIYAGRGKEANETYKYFGPALNRDRRLRPRTERRPERSSSASSSARASSATAVSERGDELSSAISNASTAFGAIAGQNVALDRSLRLLPPIFRQSNTTFVNLRAALDDLEPLIDTAKPATKDLAPFLAELRPVLSESGPGLQEPPPHRAPARATPTTPPNCSPRCRRSSSAPRKAFPHSEEAIAAFQPNLNFVRAYTPDIFNGFAKLGQVTGYYDGNGHYARASFADLNLFNYNSGSGELEPIAPSEQYDAFGSAAGVKRRCPGGATQPAADGSNPFVEPPFSGSGVTPSECNPADVPPGP